MAFKMKGFNPGKGTGMGSGLTYVPQSLRGKFDDHPDKKDNVNYDEGGRPEVKGGIDFSTIDPRNSKFFNINKRTDRMVVEPTDKELERAIAFYKKMEQKLGPGQVTRDDFSGQGPGGSFFDLLLFNGGSEEHKGSWVQERMYDAAYGKLDNTVPENVRLYSRGEWDANKSPSIKTIQNNLQDMIMETVDVAPSNDPNWDAGTNPGTNISKKDAKNMATNLVQHYDLGIDPEPVRDSQNTTLEEEEEEANRIEAEDEEAGLPEIVHPWQKDDYTGPPIEEEDEEEVEEEIEEEQEMENEVKEDYSGDNPHEYGTDEYYAWKKEKRGRVLGLTKSVFNMYKNY